MKVGTRWRGEDGCLPEGTEIDAAESAEVLQQLIDFGYVAALHSDAATAQAESRRELDYNLAQAYMDGGRMEDAAQLLEKLWERWPHISLLGRNLLSCRIALGDARGARFCLRTLRERNAAAVAAGKAGLEALHAAIRLAEDPPEADPPAKGNPVTSQSDSRAQQQHIQQLWRQSRSKPDALAYYEGCVHLMEGRAHEAICLLEQAKALQGFRRPNLYLKLGDAHRMLEAFSAAQDCYLKVLDLVGDHIEAHIGLARIYLEQGDAFRAATEALAALERCDSDPRAHTLYGTALLRLGRPHMARKSLLTALSLKPTHRPAHHQLAQLYEGPLMNREAARVHRQLHCQLTRTDRRPVDRRQPVHAGRRVSAPLWGFPELSALRKRIDADADALIVVAGLPRSGTSLMMQLLAAGGVELVYDDLRAADISNPRGYFEDQRVKQLAAGFRGARDVPGQPSTRGTDWLVECLNKGVKIVVPLTTRIPPDLPARIILMQRDPVELLSSQRAQRQVAGKAGAAGGEASLTHVFAAYLKRLAEWAHARENVELLPIEYSNVVAYPELVAYWVCDFLGRSLDQAAMAAVVDPALYRQRLGSRANWPL